jgi:hypothetical protein
MQESDGLKHRRLDLEKLALELQVGPHQERVLQVLDSHHQDLPPLDQQTEDDKIGDFPCIGWTCGIMILAKQ